MEWIVYPISLRPGVAATVKVPSDLTKEEAEKIGRILLALATPPETPPATADDQ